MTSPRVGKNERSFTCGPTLSVRFRPVEAYLRSVCKVRPDDKRELRRAMGEQARGRGVYVIFTGGNEVLYVGKTSGDKMDFGRRLYRHANKKAAGKHRLVYNRLVELKQRGLAAHVGLIPVERIRLHFGDAGRRIREHVAIGLFEQALIAYLDPELQQEQKHTKR